LAHQIESFNDCLENKIPEIIERCNRLSPVI
jgi:DNA-directed RNA polymerase II subunit RPB2